MACPWFSKIKAMRNFALRRPLPNSIGLVFVAPAGPLGVEHLAVRLERGWSRTVSELRVLLAKQLLVCPQAWHRQVVCKGSKLTRLNSFWFQAGEAIEQAVDAQIFSSRYTLMTTKGCDSERMVCRTRAVRYWSFEISENVGRGT